MQQPLSQLSARNMGNVAGSAFQTPCLNTDFHTQNGALDSKIKQLLLGKVGRVPSDDEDDAEEDSSAELDVGAEASVMQQQQQQQLAPQEKERGGMDQSHFCKPNDYGQRL